ncbi:MAG: hypothetical protein R3E53_15510 [Myxococcota bacterium]
MIAALPSGSETALKVRAQRRRWPSARRLGEVEGIVADDLVEAGLESWVETAPPAQGARGLAIGDRVVEGRAAQVDREGH